MRTRIFKVAPDFWFKKNIYSYLLLPISWIYCGISMLRRLLYLCGIFKITRFNVPIVVVGNMTVGGSGKTPLVMWLANLLIENGYHVGIVSRGHGGKAQNYPLLITRQSDPATVGDEAVVIANNVNCPFVIDPDRAAAVKKLLQAQKCDVIFSDDGLQHYALGRDLEIVVVDGERGFGNGFCLPAGPLRESLSRIKHADFIIRNFTVLTLDIEGMSLIPSALVNLKNPGLMKNMDEVELLRGKPIHAVAGLGNPHRFFKTLRLLGLTIIEHAFPDHYLYQKEDFSFGENAIIIMTEKDAVKCKDFANDNFWYLQVKTEVSANLQRELLTEITKLIRR
jgi:tetraacyldisaccharide 4'-kinase